MTTQNYIDWEKLRTIDEVFGLPKHLLFDEAEVKQPYDMLKFNPNLTEEEIQDAFFWKDYLSGLMLVTGEAGSGKGVFMHQLAYKMRYYFGKLVVTDTRPRESFGNCIPFSFPMLIDQLERIAEVESGIPRPMIYKGMTKADFEDEEEWKDYKSLSTEAKYQYLKNSGRIDGDVTLREFDDRRNQFICTPNFKPYVDNVTGKWWSSRGEVFIRNTIMLLDEFSGKYMPKMKPSLSEAQILLEMFNRFRHIHSLILGVGITLNDFNPRAIDKATWQAKCIRANNREYIYSDNPEDIIILVDIDQIKFNPITGTVQTDWGKTERLTINGSEPKSWLDGRKIIDIYNTDNAQGIYLPSRLRKKQ